MSNQTIKVLLIEDNLDLAGLIGQMLVETPGPLFQLVSVPQLSEGVKRLATDDVDLVVLDLALPDSSGLNSLSQIHQQRPDMPIVVLTALNDEEIALRALQEGAQDYLLKEEINGTILVRALRYALERKRGEEARSRLAAIVESSRDAIIGMSLEGIIVSWNPGAERIFGYAFEDLVGRSMAVLVPPDCPDEMPLILERLKRGDFVKEFETVRLKKNSERIHIAASVSPIKNSVGAVIGASMISQDIEERIHAEKEREALVHQLQATLAHVNTLKGLLPICASCKKIRDDQGYWTQVEVYVRDRSQAEFTHGICPECAQAYRSGMNKAG
jgi:PAS domain S-box-containing protein